MDPPCTLCNKNPAHDRCKACKFTRYCSKDCQTKDWKDHKLICRLAASFFNNPNAKYDQKDYRNRFQEYDGSTPNRNIREAIFIHLAYLKASLDFFNKPEIAYFHINAESPTANRFTIERIDLDSTPLTPSDSKILSDLKRFDPGTIIAFYVTFETDERPVRYSLMNRKALDEMRNKLHQSI